MIHSNSIYSTTNLLSKSLDASWKRSQLIADNIANVDTPNYKRKDVVFEQYLNRALQTNGKIDDEKLSRIQPKVIVDNNQLSYRLDGNNVDIDVEMAYMAENQIKYNTLVSQINYNFERLKMVMQK